MKTEVYSWRVSPDLKTALEREARRRKISLSAVLDLATQELLVKSSAENDNEEEQRRLQQAAAKYFGIFTSGKSRRSASVGPAMRQRLRRRYGR